MKSEVSFLSGKKLIKTSSFLSNLTEGETIQHRHWSIKNCWKEYEKGAQILLMDSLTCTLTGFRDKKFFEIFCVCKKNGRIF